MELEMEISRPGKVMEFLLYHVKVMDVWEKDWQELLLKNWN